MNYYIKTQNILFVKKSLQGATPKTFHDYFEKIETTHDHVALQTPMSFSPKLTLPVMEKVLLNTNQQKNEMKWKRSVLKIY